MINSILLGNCLEILPTIKSSSVQLVLADLPYGITSNKWDSEIDLDLLWPELLRIGVKNAVFAFTACQPFTSRLTMSNVELWRHEWVWIKNRGSNFANTVREPFKEHETVQIFSRGQWKYNKQMQPRTGAGASRVKYKLNQRSKSTNYRDFEGREGTEQGELRVPSSWQKFNTEVGIHPNQKPVSLMEYLIKTYTDEGDMVLDPTCGSGTTCLAAKNLNRSYIGIENDTTYYERAVQRLVNNNK